MTDRLRSALAKAIVETPGLTGEQFLRLMIMTMRESTAAMNNAGEYARYHERGLADQVWEAMIDEALR